MGSASQTHSNAKFSGPRAHLLAGIQTRTHQSSPATHSPQTYKSPHTAHTLPPKTARNLGFAVQKQETTTNRQSPPLSYSGNEFRFEGYTPEESLQALTVLEYRKQELLTANLLLAQQQILLQNMQLSQAYGGNHNGSQGYGQRYQTREFERTMPPTPPSATKSPYFTSPQTPKFQMSVTKPGPDENQRTLPPTPLSLPKHQRKQSRDVDSTEVQVIRQPKGAPSVEELKTPSGKSKNFAMMTRKRAVNKIVEAGIIRRRASPSPSNSSGTSSRLEDELDVAFPRLPQYN